MNNCYYSQLKNNKMSYSLALITTIADCDALIVSAKRKKRDIEYRRTAQERQYETATETGGGTDATLTAKNAEISALETAVAGMDAGPTKKGLEDKIFTLKYERFVLQNRRLKYGVFAVLEKEYMLGSIEKELLEVADYIASLEARKLQL
jgi:hypothetical protein